MDDSAPMYSYMPLLDEEFRLISIQRGKGSQQIVLKIFHAPLNTHNAPDQPAPPYFEALSYTWGDRDDTEEVICIPRARLTVTRNLANALRRLRYSDRPRTVWADAICINQEDTSERNHQVRLMVAIYGSAHRVLVYLGEEDKDSNQAMDCIDDFRGPISTSDGVAVRSLFRRPWFRRIWVVQEVARSRAAIILCGTKAVSWDCFNIWPFRETSVKITDGSDTPGVLRYASGFNPTRGTLLKLLHETRGARASDDRDKIFGLLGLIPFEEQWMSLVDYGKSIEDIYTQVAVTILQDSKSLGLFSAVKRTSLSLPSWVPDWSTPYAANNLGIGSTYREPNDAGGSPAEFILDTSNTLYAKGVMVDRIRSIGKSCEDRSFIKLSTLTEWKRIAGLDIENMYKNITGPYGRPDQLVPNRPIIEQFLNVISGDSATVLQTADRTANPWLIKQTPGYVWLTEYRPSTGHFAAKVSLSETAMRFHRRVMHVSYGRAFFVTENGTMGLAPEGAEVGDEVVVLLGGPVPYILRQRPGIRPGKNLSQLAYELIGESYVPGIMNCEALHHERAGLEASGFKLSPTSSSVSSSPLQWFCIA